MQIIFSHIAAFCILFVASVFDLKTTEVPDSINVIGVIMGLGLHTWATLNFINFDIFFSNLIFSSPLKWASSLGDPLIWSLTVGIIFSIYGWGLYYLGMWGGADSFAMTVLGFSAPYSLNSISITYPINMFTAILCVGFVYTMGFGMMKLLNQPEVISKTTRNMRKKKKRLMIEVSFAALISGITALTSLKLGAIYFVSLLIMIFIYRLFSNIQDDLMVKEVMVADLEGGEVLTKSEDQGGKIQGITEKEIETIEKEKVKIREGIKFLPVFPISLFLVDVIGFRISWIVFLFNL